MFIILVCVRMCFLGFIPPKIATIGTHIDPLVGILSGWQEIGRAREICFLLHVDRNI